MRYLWLLIIAMVVLAGAAQAQIAAPRLNPNAIESSNLTPNRLVKSFNPAVMPWSGPSRIGLGFVDFDAEETIAGVTQPVVSGDGPLLQGRLVGEMFAVGVEVLQLDLEFQGIEADFDGSLVGVGVQFGGFLAIGVSQQSAELSTPVSSESETLPSLGVSLRFGETFYLGLASGDETLEQSFAGTTTEAERTVTHIGVGYHFRDDDRGIHIEVFQTAVDAIDDPVFGTREEEETTAFTVEVVFSNILLGYEGWSTEKTDPTSGTLTEETDYSTVSIGWVPMEGLTIVASLTDEETNDIINNEVVNIESTTVGIAWAF